MQSRESIDIDSMKRMDKTSAYSVRQPHLFAHLETMIYNMKLYVKERHFSPIMPEKRYLERLFFNNLNYYLQYFPESVCRTIQTIKFCYFLQTITVS